TGRRVALKVITSDLSKHDQVMARFEREVRAAGTIESEHIVQVFDAGHDDASDRPYMVMEFLDGEDLQQVSRRLGAVPTDLVVRIVAQPCRGLAKAHARGIIHRDIKPGNLFLAKRDNGDLLLKILDFGIAKVKMDHLQTAEEGGLTRTGTMLG